MITLAKIFLTAFLINNIILMRFIALCPYIGMTGSLNQSIGMGFAVTFVTVMATVATWPIYTLILAPLGLGFLQILVFILIIASLVQLVEFFLKKSVPSLYMAMGIYLPLITTNCAVLGVPLLNIQENHDFIESMLYGFGGAVGFGMVLALFAAMRERLEGAAVPGPFKGSAIAMVTAGLLSVAFMGFSGLIK